MATGECRRFRGEARSGPASDSRPERTPARTAPGQRARRSGPEPAGRFGEWSRYESPEQRVGARRYRRQTRGGGGNLRVCAQKRIKVSVIKVTQK